MRMRLARNYNYNTHEDASKLRDTGQSSTILDNVKADPELLAKVSRMSTISADEEDVLLEQLWSDANSPAVVEEASTGGANLKEKKLMKGVECHVIMLMDRIPGKLEITNKHLYFLSSPTEKNSCQTCQTCEWYFS